MEDEAVDSVLEAKNIEQLRKLAMRLALGNTRDKAAAKILWMTLNQALPLEGQYTQPMVH